MQPPVPALRFLAPPWFAIVMGLAGLALAWHRALPAMGETAGHVSLVIASAAALAFALLLGASLLRARRHREALREDFTHPVRHPFVAALPISLLLLATAAVALGGPSPAARLAWWIASLLQWAVTAWVVGRWLRGNGPGGIAWPSLTPALFIPVVGNVLAPLAGVPLGHPDWSAAQFATGLFFWPIVLALVFVRLALHGSWPDRLRPSVFILVAPPAVVGLALLQLGAPDSLAWGAWGIACFCLCLAALQAKAIAQQPFAIAHWALSFPLAAFSALTLRLSTPGTAFAALGVVALALTSLVILALCFATVRGLRQGTLLAPEPFATLQPAAAD